MTRIYTDHRKGVMATIRRRPKPKGKYLEPGVGYIPDPKCHTCGGQGILRGRVACECLKPEEYEE
jgi:hypothetical protein